MTRYGKAITVGGQPVVMAIGVITWDHDMYEHIVVIQNPDTGAATVARMERLEDADQPGEVIDTFDAGTRQQNRRDAVDTAMNVAGYVR